MTSRPSTAAPILAALAIVLVTLGAYVGGYSWLGRYNLLTVPGSASRRFAVARSYPQRWALIAYQPAGGVEAWLRQQEVYLLWDGDAAEEMEGLPP